MQSRTPNPSAPLSASQPSQLHRDMQLGSNQDDIASPLSSIDASQAQDSASSSYSQTTLAQLPADLLLRIVEYVPVDYVLDWRLVCRSFRDAIDGPVLYQCLRRTRLLGYMGSKQSLPSMLDDDAYDQIQMLEARFYYLDLGPGDSLLAEARGKPIWNRSYAMFRIDDEWYRAFHRIGGAEQQQQGHPVINAHPGWFHALSRLEQLQPEERFGTLRWCIALDHAVLDLDFPCEMDEMNFDIDIDLVLREIRVAWKGMLFNFLKTERVLRRLLDEKYSHSTFTFKHTEKDCLRAVRRARLSASRDLSSQRGRQLQRSLNLPPHLYGLPNNTLRHFGHDYFDSYPDIENDAVQQLLVLRHSTFFSSEKLSYLQGLASDFRKLQAHLLCNEGECYCLFTCDVCSHIFDLACTPVVLPDELEGEIEWLVLRWREQGKPVKKLKGLVEAALAAKSVP